MDALRRLRSRASQAKYLVPGTRYEVADTRHSLLRLRGADRRLGMALDQLRSGVPLNWGQVEDDPELATLARLQQAGEECRLTPLQEPSAQAKADLLAKLTPLIPQPQAKQEKIAPKTLAGFSENVQVLTQVDDDVRLNVNWAASIFKGALGLALVVAVIWGLGSLFKAQNMTTFSWIQARKGDEPLTRLLHSYAGDELPCRVVRSENPNRPGVFVRMPSLRDAQAGVDYNIPLLPRVLPRHTGDTVRYTFQLTLASVDPCEGNSILPSDPAALIGLHYSANRQETINSATATLTGNPPGTMTRTTAITLFAAHEQITAIDVTGGDWKEIEAGEARGIYWHGASYRDQDDTQWAGDVNVMLLEREDTVVTLVGSADDGITEEILLELAQAIIW